MAFQVSKLNTQLLGIACLTLVSGCTPEQRPTPGSVERIGPAQTGSISGVLPASSGVGAPVSGLPERPPPATATTPSRADGVYTPVSNVDGYLYFALDYQDIIALTNVVNAGRALPSADILAIYENGRNFRTDTATRALRAFARGEARAREFPEAAEYYRSATFLDDPLVSAIAGIGPASSYSPPQRRQAIQKAILRIFYYHTIQELRAAEPKIEAGNLEPIAGAPHNVDEAWAIYMGAPDGNAYPRSLSGAARAREMNFNREGALDVPARQALQRAQQAAAAGNRDEFRAALRDYESRLNAIFYVSAARYLNESLKAAQSGNMPTAAVSQIEGLAFYMTIQPLVARANAAADQAVVGYYRADPGSLSTARRDEALALLNSTLGALGLSERDRVSPADLQ